MTGSDEDGASLGVWEGIVDGVPPGVDGVTGALETDGLGGLALGFGANAEPQLSGSAQPENSSVPVTAPAASA